MSRYTLRVTLAGLTLAAATAGLAAPTLAAAVDDAPPAAGAVKKMHGHGAGHGRHLAMPRDGLLVPGVGAVTKAQIEQLKLNASQQALLDSARAAQRDLMKARRHTGTERRSMLDQQLQAGKLDPRALVTQSEQARVQLHGQAGQVRDKWLAVWDSLNDTQRQQVATLVQERRAKMEKKMARLHAKAAARRETP